MDIDYVRSQFPALEQDFIFLDNAGGSQILKPVLSRIQSHLIERNVQLGASYSVSAQAGRSLDRVHQKIAEYIKANEKKEIVIGPSTTMLLRILSICISQSWKEGDEVIVTNSDHEANVSCWTDLKAKGIKIKIWRLNPESLEFELDDLKALLTPKTKLVAMVHASNILGTINPIKDIARVVHDNGALLCVDGVAFAPHRAIDVNAFGADFYTFSWYKVYGPHLAVMWGRKELLEALPSINHYFIGRDQLPYKLQPGNFNFELTAGLEGIIDYFEDFSKHHKIEAHEHFNIIADHEELLAKRLLGFLNAHSNVRIIGKKEANKEVRVPTISFVHNDHNSKSIVERVDPHRIGIRYGDFYAKKLIYDLGLEHQNGVVRVSMVHYNSMEEMHRLIEILDRIL